MASKKNTEHCAGKIESTIERIEYLDGWRGLAILLVLGAHFFGITFMDTGRLGVDVFFVLSGMLMSNILFVKKTPLPIFYQRRISRIFPVFFLFIATIYIVTCFLNVDFSTRELFSTLTFMRTYFPSEIGIWDSAVPIGHLWSINIEEHFYVILSLITLISWSKFRNGTFLIMLGLISILVTVLYVKFPDYAPLSYALRTETATTCLFFSAGYFLLKEKVIPYVRPWFPIVTFLGAASCYSVSVPWWCSFLLAPFLLAVTINHLPESSVVFRNALSFPLLRMLGIWSYSIYLWQQPFYVYKANFPPGVAFVLAMAVSLVSFYFFENPSRNHINDRFATRRKMRTVAHEGAV